MPIEVPDIDEFGSTADRKIRVWSTDRFLACVDLVAKVDLPVEATWRLLTDEHNAKIFKSIKVKLAHSWSGRVVMCCIWMDSALRISSGRAGGDTCGALRHPGIIHYCNTQ